MTALILGGFSYAQSDPPSVVLAPRLGKQPLLYVELTEENNQLFKGGRFGEEGLKTKRISTIGVLEKVETHSSKRARLNLKFDRLLIHSQQGDRTVSFDTDVSDQVDLSIATSTLLVPILGESLQLDYSLDGFTFTVSGAQKILEKVEKTGVGGALLVELRDVLSDQAAQWIWADSRFVVFTGHEVSEGGVWTRDLRRRTYLFGDLLYHYDLKIEKIGMEENWKRDVVLVSYKGTIRRAQDGPSPAFGNFEEGALEGAGVVDADSGMLLQLAERQLNKITLKVPVADSQTVDDVSIEQRLSRTYTVAGVEQRQQQKLENRQRAESVKDIQSGQVAPTDPNKEGEP